MMHTKFLVSESRLLHFAFEDGLEPTANQHMEKEWSTEDIGAKVEAELEATQKTLDTLPKQQIEKMQKITEDAARWKNIQQRLRAPSFALPIRADAGTGLNQQAREEVLKELSEFFDIQGQSLDQFFRENGTASNSCYHVERTCTVAGQTARMFGRLFLTQPTTRGEEPRWYVIVGMRRHHDREVPLRDRELSRQDVHDPQLLIQMNGDRSTLVRVIHNNDPMNAMGPILESLNLRRLAGYCTESPAHVREYFQRKLAFEEDRERQIPTPAPDEAFRKILAGARYVSPSRIDISRDRTPLVTDGLWTCTALVAVNERGERCMVHVNATFGDSWKQARAALENGFRTSGTRYSLISGNQNESITLQLFEILRTELHVQPERITVVPCRPELILSPGTETVIGAADARGGENIMVYHEGDRIRFGRLPRTPECQKVLTTVRETGNKRP